MQERIYLELRQIENWISQNGYAGWDPYDVKGQEWFLKAFGRKGIVFKKFRGLFSIIERRFDQETLRKVLRIQKVPNAKGVGLIASAWLSMYRSGLGDEYLHKAEDALLWLRTNSNTGYMGFSWGYPFHWHSRILIPKGTPSSVVTGTVADAWIDYYRLTGSSDALKVIQGIADFFLQHLTRYERDKDQVCFSYTPIDTYRVHNASLFTGAFLAQASEILNKPEYANIAAKTARFTTAEQNPDGSFNYWSGEPDSVVDHYHTGFVLRHLNTIVSVTDIPEIQSAIEKGYRFYRSQLFTVDNIPMFSPKSIYPIDIHSCAEAILTNTTLYRLHQDLDFLEVILEFVMNTMKTGPGTFRYRIEERNGKKKHINISYIRWGQAWMFLSLARLYELLHRLEKT